MTREEAEFVNNMCENVSITWTKIHIEYQKKFVSQEHWYESNSGYQKGTELPHGSQIEGSELCKQASKILNKI